MNGTMLSAWPAMSNLDIKIADFSQLQIICSHVEGRYGLTNQGSRPQESWCSVHFVLLFVITYHKSVYPARTMLLKNTYTSS